MTGTGSKGRGGKRKGAGRHSKYGEPTETIRLPVSIVKAIKVKGVEWLKELIARAEL